MSSAGDGPRLTLRGALVLGGLAAAVGLGVANFLLDWWLAASEIDAAGRRPFWFGGGFAPATVIYAIALTVLGALVAGIVPALKVTGRTAGSSTAVLPRACTAPSSAERSYSTAGAFRCSTVSRQRNISRARTRFTERDGTELRPSSAIDESVCRIVVWRVDHVGLDATRTAGRPGARTLGG
jgi:hypothetical protein